MIKCTQGKKRRNITGHKTIFKEVWAHILQFYVLYIAPLSSNYSLSLRPLLPPPPPYLTQTTPIKAELCTEGGGGGENSNSNSAGAGGGKEKVNYAEKVLLVWFGLVLVCLMDILDCKTSRRHTRKHFCKLLILTNFFISFFFSESYEHHTRALFYYHILSHHIITIFFLLTSGSNCQTHPKKSFLLKKFLLRLLPLTLIWNVSHSHQRYVRYEEKWTFFSLSLTQAIRPKTPLLSENTKQASKQSILLIECVVMYLLSQWLNR